MDSHYKDHVINYALTLNVSDPDVKRIIETGEFTEVEADRIIVIHTFHKKKLIPPNQNTIWKEIAFNQSKNTESSVLSTRSPICPCYVCGRFCDRIRDDENWRICYIIPVNLIKIVEFYNIRIVCDVCDMDEGTLLPYHYALLKGIKDSLAVRERITSPSRALQVWYEKYHEEDEDYYQRLQEYNKKIE